MKKSNKKFQAKIKTSNSNPKQKVLVKNKKFLSESNTYQQQKVLSKSKNILPETIKEVEQKVVVKSKNILHFLIGNMIFKFVIYFIILFMLFSLLFSLTGLEKNLMGSNYMEPRIQKGDIVFFKNDGLVKDEPYVVLVGNISAVMYLDSASDMRFRNNVYYVQADQIEGRVVFAMPYITYLMTFYIIMCVLAWFLAKKTVF